MSVTVLHGDCLDLLPGFDPDSLHACVTDPPYHLLSTDEAFVRVSRGFMGKRWDGGDVAFRAETWAAVLRVLKPGAHLLCFGGTRTYHRVACAIENAGFEVRDAIMWHYGSGFPKSHDAERSVAVATCQAFGRHHARKLPPDDEREPFDHVCHVTPESEPWRGYGTALKPATEIICVARKPLIGTVAANVLAHGCGALNIDGCRVPAGDAPEGRTRHGGGIPGNGTSFELPDSRGEMPEGRWPANLIHDGSDEVLAAFPNAPGQQAEISTTAPSPKTSGIYGAMRREGEASAGRRYTDRGSTDFAAAPGARRLDSGSAARFFQTCQFTDEELLRFRYNAKANAADRAGSKHPTVKPVALLRYLVRLVTPPGGAVLDPFAGSGTLVAALAEGFDAILIEREAEYVADIRRRIVHAAGAE